MPPDVLAKFEKVLGLLASDQDGERASAAKIATAMLRQCRMTWADVADSLRGGETDRTQWLRQKMGEQRNANPYARDTRSPHMREAADLLKNWPDRLSLWETEFLRNILGRKEISRKQTDALTRIRERVFNEASVWRGS